MIMDSTMDQLSCVPPGFRFHPTDEELVGYYLRKKVASQKIDLDVIRDIDLYRIEPWDLIEKCWIGYEEQSDWYFFSHKDKKYPTGTRTNRATMAGFWKATGRDKAIYEKQRLIGMRKTLVFYQGRAPNGQKTDWIMHEYRLESEENAPPQEEGWVVCRAFKKRATGQQTKTTTRLWESSNYFYDEASRQVSSVMNNHDYARIFHQPTSNILLTAENTFMCKQELEAATDHQNMNFVHNCDQFIQQLPQLESPSLQSTKRSISSIYENDHHQEDNQIKRSNTNNNNNSIISNDVNEVRDWRDLDKFVASQLSQEEEMMIRCVGDQGFYSNNHPAGGLDFTTSTYHQGDDRKEAAGDGGGGIGELEGKSNGLLSSTSTSLDHFDIGICIFDNL